MAKVSPSWIAGYSDTVAVNAVGAHAKYESVFLFSTNNLWNIGRYAKLIKTCVKAFEFHAFPVKTP